MTQKCAKQNSSAVSKSIHYSTGGNQFIKRDLNKSVCPCQPQRCGIFSHNPIRLLTTVWFIYPNDIAPHHKLVGPSQEATACRVAAGSGRSLPPASHVEQVRVDQMSLPLSWVLSIHGQADSAQCTVRGLGLHSAPVFTNFGWKNLYVIRFSSLTGKWDDKTYPWECIGKSIWEMVGR